MRAGRSLDALLSAYRLGSRLAWRRFVEAGVAGGLDPGAIYALGEAIFAYIDELSAESAEGYAEEQSAAAGERQRLRRRLVRLLAQDAPPSEETILAAAAAAAWPLPRTVAALVTAPGEAARDRARTASGAPPPAAAMRRDARVAGRGGRVGRARGAAGAADRRGGDRGGHRAAGGRARARRRRARPRPARSPPPPRAARPRSGPRCRSRSPGSRCAAPPRRTRCSPPAGWATRAFARAEEHLPALVIAADPRSAPSSRSSASPRSQTLADGPRARLTETLRAWLDRPGQVQAVAAELGVHPQTVRYRVKQLRELFGDRAGGPRGALRARARPARAG